MTYSKSPIITKDFLLEVNMGKHPGYSTVTKYGKIAEATGPTDIWETGTSYIYDPFGTAPIISLSSSSLTDNQLIEVQGLDINGNFVSQEIQLVNQANVPLSTPLWRVFRMRNISARGNDVTGVIYCYTTTNHTDGVPVAATIRATIQGVTNGTFMAIYTIPRGKVGFLYRGEAGVELSGGASALAEFGRIEYRSGLHEKNFISGKSVSIVIGGSGEYKDPRSFPDVIPALTDLRISVSEVSVNMGLWATFDILLVDEKLMSKEYLEAIGQPFISI